ncbi:MAG TPA: alpha-ketoglutarate-dependent dioxygenase AlkB [Polyangiaceae bacterium]|nr:alpha-ketoglutarate-dependent dioxygenase AlkB [Polyangiaceae bacterium]
MAERIDLGEGAWLSFEPAFVSRDAATMAALVGELPLRQETIVLFGREVVTPRLTSWHGDPGCSYRYSGRAFEPSAWTRELADLRDRLNEGEGCDFNSVLANYYRDGQDAMGEHADDEPELGPSRDDVRIASVSLGAPRRFVLRHKKTREVIAFDLGAGSLLVMGGTTQRYYRHHVPRSKKPLGARLNLTYRVLRRLDG